MYLRKFAIQQMILKKILRYYQVNDNQNAHDYRYAFAINRETNWQEMQDPFFVANNQNNDE